MMICLQWMEFTQHGSVVNGLVRRVLLPRLDMWATSVVYIRRLHHVAPKNNHRHILHSIESPVSDRSEPDISSEPEASAANVTVISALQARQSILVESSTIVLQGRITGRQTLDIINE